MQFNEFTERFSSGTELRNHENREDEGRNFHGSDSFSRDLRLKSGCWQGVVNGPNSRCQILRDAIAMKLLCRVATTTEEVESHPRVPFTRGDIPPSARRSRTARPVASAFERASDSRPIRERP